MKTWQLTILAADEGLAGLAYDSFQPARTLAEAAKLKASTLGGFDVEGYIVVGCRDADEAEAAAKRFTEPSNRARK